MSIWWVKTATLHLMLFKFVYICIHILLSMCIFSLMLMSFKHLDCILTFFSFRFASYKYIKYINSCFILVKVMFLFQKKIINYWKTKEKSGDFPGGSVVKNLPSNAGGTSSIPGRGTKTPRALEQLCRCATALSPQATTWREACQLQGRAPTQQPQIQCSQISE